MQPESVPKADGKPFWLWHGAPGIDMSIVERILEVISRLYEKVEELPVQHWRTLPWAQGVALPLSCIKPCSDLNSVSACAHCCPRPGICVHCTARAAHETAPGLGAAARVMTHWGQRTATFICCAGYHAVQLAMRSGLQHCPFLFHWMQRHCKAVCRSP